MTITAGALLGKVSKILFDETNVRWPITTELIGWLDSAQREVALLKPQLSTTTAARKLVAGTKQSLAAGVIGLGDVVRNMGTAGTTPGKAIVLKDRKVMDQALPDWHTYPASDQVVNFFYDQKNPKVYYVWPPQPATNQGYVEEVLYVAPTALVDANSAISFDDIYENILINLVLARAFAKDSELPMGIERSQVYRTMAMEELGLRNQVEPGAAPDGPNNGGAA